MAKGYDIVQFVLDAATWTLSCPVSSFENITASVVVGVMLVVIDSPCVPPPSVVPLALAEPVEVDAVVSEVEAVIVTPKVAEALALSRASSPQPAIRRGRGKRKRRGEHVR